ncbi:MAG: glycosyltransferase family 4 protein [Candidatus Thermoplasmatota archaeon]|nr:glycosyltransferase family 4 protein [Candidatus Thermoplasmatota archaeon]
MRVLHVLANGPPDVNGYAIRTKMILEHLHEFTDAEVIGLTSPWYPRNEKMVETHQERGVTYLRTPHPAQSKDKLPLLLRIARWVELRHQYHYPQNPEKALEMKKKREESGFFGKIIRLPAYCSKIIWKLLEEKILIWYFKNRIVEVSREHQIELIHAHTPYRVGLPALKAARKLKIPFIYEMRGMWEETAVANGRWMKNGPAYKRFRRFESKILAKSDHVICISEALESEAISRGVKAENITVVPNGISPRLMMDSTIESEVETVRSQLQINQKTTVIGYIGSLREMEGVNQTAEAVAELHAKGFNVRLFVLTSISGQAELKSFCRDLGIEGQCIIMGPVSHDQVWGYYDLIDVFVVSRPSTRVTEFVTPLKPFEAMAMGKCVIASDLLALREIIQQGETGLLYNPESFENLSHEIEKCIKNPELKNSLGQNAKLWVLQHRKWEDLIEQTFNSYQKSVRGDKE